jgi:hypothetical protein
LVSFSYWLIKPWFLTEEKLTDVLIIPSSWGSQLVVNATHITGCDVLRVSFKFMAIYGIWVHADFLELGTIRLKAPSLSRKFVLVEAVSAVGNSGGKKLWEKVAGSIRRGKEAEMARYHWQAGTGRRIGAVASC